MTCCRCQEPIDTDEPPIIDLRTGGLVCLECKAEERAWWEAEYPEPAA